MEPIEPASTTPKRGVERLARGLEAVVRQFLAPLLEARPGPNGWKLTSWDAEQGITLVIGRGERFLLVELEARDEALDCYARTKQFNVCARSQFTADGQMTDEERRVVDSLLRLVRAREGLLVIDPRLSAKASEVREITVESVLMPEGGDHYYLNAYAGCMIGCTFCYVGPRAELSRRIEGAPPPAWGRWVDVKINAPEILAAEVRRFAPGLVRMSPILTDPYQPIEKRYRISRQCIEILIDAGFGPLVLTREARVLEDLPLIARGRSVVGFSIPTDDDRLRQAFEPGADTIENRFEALRRCAEAGVATVLVVQPALPMNVDAFVERTARWTKIVRIDHMHFGERVAAQYAAAGIGFATSPAWQQELKGQLTERFLRAGVTVEENDDLARLCDDLVRPPDGWKRP